MSHYTDLTEKKTPAELSRLLAEKRETLRKNRFHAKGTHTRNTKEARNTRKDIARVLTRLREVAKTDSIA
jgi:ribosomal protein L29